MMWEEELVGFFCLSSTRRLSWCGVAVAAIWGRKNRNERYHMGMTNTPSTIIDTSPPAPGRIIAFPPSVWSAIAWLSNRLQLSQTLVIRESVEMYYMLQKEMENGGQIIVERKDGDRVLLHFGKVPSE